MYIIENNIGLYSTSRQDGSENIKNQKGNKRMSNFQIPSPAFTVLALPCHGKLPTQKEVSLAVSFELQEKTAVCSDLCHSSSHPEPRAGLGSVDMMWEVEVVQFISTGLFRLFRVKPS